MHLTPHPFLSSDLQQNPSSLTQATDNIPQHGQRSLLVKKTAGDTPYWLAFRNSQSALSRPSMS